MAKTSLNSANLVDVSFAGSIVTIGGVKVQNFMDDANPIEFPDCTVTSFGMNLNGTMIRYAKPSAIIMSVTVIPGSDEDIKFYNGWCQYRVQDGKNNAQQWSKSLTASIVLGNQNAKKTEFKFSGGTFVSGPGGPNASADGKMRGRTYTFAFAKVDDK